MNDTPEEATLTTGRKKKIGWADPFETEILQKVLAPRLRELLHEGVRNRTHLLEKWESRFGCNPGAERMQRWLESLGYAALFGDKPLIRVPLVQQAPPAQDVPEFSAPAYSAPRSVSIDAPEVGPDGLPKPRVIAPSVIRTTTPDGRVIEIPGINNIGAVSSPSHGAVSPTIRNPLEIPGMSGSIQYTTPDYANDGPPGVTING